MAASCKESQFPSSMTGRKENMLAHFLSFAETRGRLCPCVKSRDDNTVCKFTNASYLQINYCCQPCSTIGLWGYYSQLKAIAQKKVLPLKLPLERSLIFCLMVHLPQLSKASSLRRCQRIFHACFNILSLASVLVTLKLFSRSIIESTLKGIEKNLL